jgi:hypothetical protein
MKRCKLCKQYPKNEATWAMQFIGEYYPSFTELGWHYRGFKVYPVCDDCYVTACGKSYEEIFPEASQRDEDTAGYNDTVADGLSRFTR